MPPVQRDGPVRSQLVGIHQDAIFTVYPFSHVKYGLVLHAFTTSIEVVLAADLRRANVANGQQLFQALVNGTMAHTSFRIPGLALDRALRARAELIARLSPRIAPMRSKRDVTSAGANPKKMPVSMERAIAKTRILAST